MEEKKERKQVQFRIDEDLYARLKAHAALKKVPVGTLLCQLIEDSLDESKKGE